MQANTSPSTQILRRVGTIVVALISGIWLLWAFVLTSPESRDLGQLILQNVESYERGNVLNCSLQIQPGKDASWVPVEAQVLAPDHLWLETQVSGVTARLGSADGSLWVHVPEKKFALVGDPDVPRFTGFPDSVEAVELPSLELPVSSGQVKLAPLFLRVRETNDGEWMVEPSRLGRMFADLPSFQITYELQEPEQGAGKVLIDVSMPSGLQASVQVLSWEFKPSNSATNWELIAPDDHEVETVALSHLTRCLEVTPRLLTADPPKLGPATGERTLVGRHGKGRLELHDGVRVLFLKGSPEEMGEQHGNLLGDEVRSMSEKILYGVGVASSFEKQRWFLGEIEEAQSRIQPFVTDAHLREMDALAQATDLHIQEARLTNFFPELFHCSGFALHGKATIGGQMYHGRILDYMRGVGLEESAVVMVCQPEGVNAWVNIGYAGFLGSVTAMNDKHLAIGEMGGRGEGDWDGKPMAQLVREVMEQCDTIEEAVELMRTSPRTCEYYYVISDAKSMRAVGIKATPDIFETVWSGESHPQLPHPVEDTVLLSADDRYEELVHRVKDGYGTFGPDEARALMTRPVCMTSNIQSVLFAPGTLDFWVANADGENVASHTRYTHFNLGELLVDEDS